MKITNIETYPVWGGGRNFLFVVVETDDGLTGVGEAGITGRELAIVGAIEHFKPLLIGQDADRIEHIWQMLFRGGFFPAATHLCARHLGDRHRAVGHQGQGARRAGLPAARRPGARQGRLLPAQRRRGRRSTALVESCLQTKEEGWQFVRWGIQPTARSWSRAGRAAGSREQFEAVREAVGDEIEICFDVHTRLDPPAAIRLCRDVEQYRPFFIEDPLRSENPQSLRTACASRRACRSPSASSSPPSGSSAS